MNIRLTTVTAVAVTAAFLVMPKLAQAQITYEKYSFATFAGFPPGSVDASFHISRLYP